MLGGQSYLGKGIGWLPTLGGVPQPTSTEEFTKQVSVTVCQSAGKGCNLKIYSEGVPNKPLKRTIYCLVSTIGGLSCGEAGEETRHRRSSYGGDARRAVVWLGMPHR